MPDIYKTHEVVTIYKLPSPPALMLSQEVLNTNKGYNFLRDTFTPATFVVWLESQSTITLNVKPPELGPSTGQSPP